MSQQAAAGQGAPAGHGGDQGIRNLKYHPCTGDTNKGFKSGKSEIAMDTFNTGQKNVCRTVYTVTTECGKLSLVHVSVRGIFGGRDRQSGERAGN